ncbi:ABC transporter substrate-binding protein [Streptomyces sp. JJ36]|uniref:ABC transporter substrate-binding protein n=1 Tax=Streptomyces sp. JJ36 TaxID=2736645 RepID=UPI001F4656A1|nr:ABC transporter substrate-binding protein [Streptomyces sp. JJ36]MCF6525146.1 ABC transporter substrate-binding protein [Streptomyces sp. JJ36]
MSVFHRSRAACAALALLTLSACGSGDSGGGQAVTLTTPTWVGGQANTAVAAYILEEELGYEVTVREMDEDDAWKAVGEGEADAILEDWGHPDLEERYVDRRQTVVPAGDLGVTGKIGWYLPDYVADEHPGITRWQGLNKYAEMFATARTGDKGRLLEGSKEFITRDEHLIDNLGLDFRTVYAGSEQAQIEEIRESARQREPFLTYWWRPHWLESEIELSEVDLPPHYPGCDTDEKSAECGYPETDLRKFLNAGFAEDGGEAAEFLKNFQWGEEDQNEVAKMIAQDGMAPRAAAARWVKENPGIWKVWLWDL